MGYETSGAAGKSRVRRDGERMIVEVEARDRDHAEAIAQRGAHGNPDDEPDAFARTMDAANFRAARWTPRMQSFVANVFGPVGFAALLVLTAFAGYFEFIGWTRLFPNVPYIGFGGVTIAVLLIVAAHAAKLSYQRKQNFRFIVQTFFAVLCYAMSFAAGLTMQSENAAERLEVAQSARSDRQDLREELRQARIQLAAMPPDSQSIEARQAQLDAILAMSSDVIIENTIPTRAELIEMCDSGAHAGNECASVRATVAMMEGQVSTARRNAAERARLEARIAEITGDGGAMASTSIDAWGQQYESLARLFGVDPVTVQTSLYMVIVNLVLLLTVIGWLWYLDPRTDGWSFR